MSLLNMRKILEDAGIHPRGVIQVGAHLGQEIPEFAAMGIAYGVFFEPLPTVLDELTARVAEYFPDGRGQVCPFALGDAESSLVMYVDEDPANRGMSSSCLKPKLHLEVSPTIQFTTRLEVAVKRLDDVIVPGGPATPLYDMLVMDVQGFEGHVLRGAEKTLQNIDVIFTEINAAELYEGCIQLPELDRYLIDRGFARVATHWAHKTWGDACYLRRA